MRDDIEDILDCTFGRVSLEDFIQTSLRRPKQQASARHRRAPTSREAAASIKSFALAQAELELVKDSPASCDAAGIRRRAMHLLHGVIIELLKDSREEERSSQQPRR